MIFTAIQLTALLLSVESVFFFSSIYLSLTPKAIVLQCRMQWDVNEALVESLCKQTINSWTGSILLGLSVALQIVALWIGANLDELGSANPMGLVIGFIIGAIIFWTAWELNKYYSVRWIDNSME